jgi:DNA-binding transcriptional LysR family regulator
MELRQIRYFLAATEFGTLTAAAAHLGVAQPAVSQAIAKLEADIGVRLFVRTQRGAELTPAGIAFRDDVIDGMGMLEGAMERAKERASGRAGRITIGIVSSALYELIPMTMDIMRRQYPRIDVLLREMNNADQLDALRSNAIDIGMVHPPVATSAWIKEKIVSEVDHVAAVPRNFPVPPDRKVAFRSLCMHKVITFHEERVPALRAGLRAAYRQAGQSMKIGQEVASMFTALSCVAAGCGVAIVPRPVTAISFPGVQFLDIREEGILPRSSLSLIWRVTSKGTPSEILVQRLIENLKEVRKSGE